MKKIFSGIVSGLIFGVLDVFIMIPLDMTEKGTAMLGAFFNRF